jgi:ketosteroid isomerase-like protein
MSQGGSVISSTEVAAANKALVGEWFALLSENRLDEAAELTDPDGTVWSPRQRLEFPFRDWYRVYRTMVGERFVDGITFELGAVTAEEDRVSVLAEARGQKRAGGEYHNLYHWYLEADGSRITKVREYNDTLYASQAFA